MEHDPTKKPDQSKLKTVNGRDEMNLAEYPFAVLSKRVSENQKTIELELGHVENDRGELVPRRWTVTGADKFGLPVAGDEEIYVAFMERTKEANNFQEREVFFTRYQLLKKMGWPTTGKYYERIAKALDRLKGVTIKAENVFYDNEAKAYVTVAFNIIDEYKLFDERPKTKQEKQMALPVSSFKWSERLWQSFVNAGYIKKLDTELYRRLKKYTSKRLLRYLDKHFYFAPIYEIGLKELATVHLGMPSTYYPSKIKQELNLAVEELIENEYLERYHYEKRGKVWWVIFEKSSQMFLPLTEKGTEPEIEENSLVAELVKRGVTKETAEGLCKKHDSERIREKIELHDHLVEQGSSLVEKNPAGYLRKAIEQDYQPPKGFISTEERKKREEKAKAQREEQTRREKKEEYQKWQAMPEDEKIKGELWVWEHRFKKEQDREPTEEEREAKREELISGLPELERKMFGDLVDKIKVKELKQKDKPVKPRKKRTEKPVERTQKTKPTDDTTQAPKAKQKPRERVSEATQDSSRSPEEKIKKIEPSAGIKHQLGSQKTITKQTRASFFVRMVKKLPFGRRIAQALEDHNVV